jgi:hypothetical protein
VSENTGSTAGIAADLESRISPTKKPAAQVPASSIKAKIVPRIYNKAFNFIRFS